MTAKPPIVNEVEQERWARRVLAEQMRHFFGTPDIPYLPADVFAQVWEDQLDARDRRVLSVRLGLFGEDRRSLTQAGKVLGLSGPRVSQLSSRCFKKFKAALEQNGRH